METMKKLTEESQLEVTREEMDRRFEVEKEEASHGFGIAGGGSCHLYLQKLLFVGVV